MPSTKPRLAITLSPESRAALERLTQTSGIASSQFVAQLIHDSIPLLNSMSAAFAEAKKSPIRAAEIMRDALGGAHIDVAQHQLELDAYIGKKKKRKLRRRPVK
jgi:hypothetical protein